MHKFSDGLEKISRVLVGILMVVLTLNVLLQVLSRQVLKLPMTWTDEVARFSFMWMAMLAASVQVRRRAHFAVTILSEHIKHRRALAVFSCLFMLFAAGMLFLYGVRYTRMGFQKLAAALPIRMYWIYAAIPAGSLFMMVYLAEMLLEECGLLDRRGGEGEAV